VGKRRAGTEARLERACTETLAQVVRDFVGPCTQISERAAENSLTWRPWHCSTLRIIRRSRALAHTTYPPAACLLRVHTPCLLAVVPTHVVCPICRRRLPGTNKNSEVTQRHPEEECRAIQPLGKAFVSPVVFYTGQHN